MEGQPRRGVRILLLYSECDYCRNSGRMSERRDSRGVRPRGRSRPGRRAGVVFDPCHNELFAATLTGAATRNGQRIYVQQISEGIEAWSSAIVGTDWPHSGEARDRTRLILGMMSGQATGAALLTRKSRRVMTFSARWISCLSSAMRRSISAGIPRVILTVPGLFPTRRTKQCGIESAQRVYQHEYWTGYPRRRPGRTTGPVRN